MRISEFAHQPSDHLDASDDEALGSELLLGRSKSYVGISALIWMHLLVLAFLACTTYDVAVQLTWLQNWWDPLLWLAPLMAVPLLWRMGEKVILTPATLSVEGPWHQRTSVTLGPSTRFRHLSSVNLIRHVYHQTLTRAAYLDGSELSTLPQDWDAQFTAAIVAPGLVRGSEGASLSHAFAPQAPLRYRFLRIHMELVDGGRSVRVPPTTESMPELAAWLHRVEMSQVFPALEERHCGGETVHFGPVALTSSELRYREKVLPLDTPIQIVVGLFRVRFWIGGERIMRTGWMFRGRGFSVPMREVDNICSLIRLLRRHHGAGFAPFLGEN